MSTRANIYIRNDYEDRDKVILYHHCDGYPKGVGRDLIRILRDLKGEDKETLTKQSLAEYICEKDPYFRITTPFVAGDAEYNYEINLSRRRVDWEHLYTGEEEWLCDF